MGWRPICRALDAVTSVIMRCPSQTVALHQQAVCRANSVKHLIEVSSWGCLGHGRLSVCCAGACRDTDGVPGLNQRHCSVALTRCMSMCIASTCFPAWRSIRCFWCRWRQPAGSTIVHWPSAQDTFVMFHTLFLGLRTCQLLIASLGAPLLTSTVHGRS